MSNPWVAGVLLLCPPAHREAAAIAAAQLSGNEADASPLFFSRAVEDLDGALVYWAAQTQARAHVVAALPRLETLYPGATWCLTSWTVDTPPPRGVASAAHHLAALGLRFREDDDDDDQL